MKKPLLLTVASLLLIGSLRAETPAAIDPNALSLLKRMSETLSNAKAFSFKSDSILEVPSSTGQFITLRSEGKLTLERPNKILSTRGGDLAPFDFYYDGSAVTAVAPDSRVYSTTKAPATIDEMLAGIRQETGVQLHFAPLLFSDPHAHFTRNLTSAALVGHTLVNGVPCDHLAFRAPGVNWEIWISSGRVALPYRLAATFTDRQNLPRKFVEFSRWNLHSRPWTSSFTFHPPSSFKEIPFKAVLKDAKSPDAKNGEAKR